MEDRRTFLKQLMALGVAAPLVGAQSPVRSAFGRAIAPSSTNPKPSGMTSQQMAGQRVIYSYAGLSVPETVVQAIAAGEAAGVIFFSENIAGSDQIAAVTEQLRQAQQRSPVSAPLWKSSAIRSARNSLTLPPV